MNGDEAFRVLINSPSQNLNDSIAQLNNLITDFMENLTLTMDVKQEVEDSKGKWIEDLGNVIVLDDEKLGFLLVDQLYYEAE